MPSFNPFGCRAGVLFPATMVHTMLLLIAAYLIVESDGTSIRNSRGGDEVHVKSPMTSLDIDPPVCCCWQSQQCCEISATCCCFEGPDCCGDVAQPAPSPTATNSPTVTIATSTNEVGTDPL